MDSVLNVSSAPTKTDDVPYTVEFVTQDDAEAVLEMLKTFFFKVCNQSYTLSKQFKFDVSETEVEMYCPSLISSLLPICLDLIRQNP